MDCYDAEGLISGYINRTLPTDELELFLEHIRECPDCYEELETQFIVNEAMNQLSEDRETDLDFQDLLEQDLKKAEKHVMHNHIQRSVVFVTFFLIALAATGVVFFRMAL